MLHVREAVGEHVVEHERVEGGHVLLGQQDQLASGEEGDLEKKIRVKIEGRFTVEVR